jgi:hypothetical protein
MPPEVETPRINPVHKLLLDTVRGTYRAKGAKLLSMPELNSVLGRSPDEAIYISFAGIQPKVSRIHTPDGSYSPLGTHSGAIDRERAMRDLVFDLSEHYDVKVLDTAAAAVVRRQIRSEVPPRGHIWRVTPLEHS